MSDYQELFLDLASRHEELMSLQQCLDGEWHYLPIPEEERAGALIRLINTVAYFGYLDPPGLNGDAWDLDFFTIGALAKGTGPKVHGATPEEALTRGAIEVGL